jgi:signal transduction histidine kinase
MIIDGEKIKFCKPRGQKFWPILIPNLVILISFILSAINNYGPMATQLLLLLSVFNGIFFSHLLFNANKTIKILSDPHKENELRDHIENHKKLITILCHDLDNSMTVINICSSLIETGLRNGQKQNYAKSFHKINNAVKNQSDIIDNIKQKVAIDSGKNIINLTPVDLVCSIKNVLSMLEKTYPALNLEMKFNYNSNADYYILAEEVSLNNYILKNILSNAIKFSQNNGQIFINLTFDEGDVVLTITDEGIGMPKEILNNLFNFYIKTNRAGLRGEKGTGFGLPLTKSFMEEYGGNISVTSEVNKGSEFILHFKRYDQEIYLKKSA